MFNDVHRLWAHGRVREVGQRCSEVEGRPSFLELKASFGVRIGSDRAQEFAEHSLALSWSPLAQQDFHMSRTYLEHVRYAGDLDKDPLHRRLHVPCLKAGRRLQDILAGQECPPRVPFKRPKPYRYI